MKAVLSFLQIVLLICLAGTSVAQTDGVPQTDNETEAEQIQALAQSLKHDLQKVLTLTGQIDSVPEMDREAVIFRRDERSFQLLQQLDKLARRTVELPTDDPLRMEIAHQLREDFGGVADMMFGRIDALHQRIASLTGKLETLSGSQRIVSEAYIHILEAMRIQSYEVLIDLIEGRLGLGHSAYKTVLVKQGQSLSVRDFESAVVIDLLRDGWAALRQSLKDQAPDILFNLLVFILIILVFRVLSRLVQRAVAAACNRPGVDLSALLRTYWSLYAAA